MLISLVLTLLLGKPGSIVFSHPVARPAVVKQQSERSPAGQESMPAGRLIEKVVCLADPTQSYALYLPTKYTRERKWPILYAFDPGARGSIPVERFKSAAEEYGWIVVGSNNSRNGPNKLAIDAFEAVWSDTHSRFALDERRAYATGFSGGARAAVGLAARCEGCIAGVIGSGAGFHSGVPVTRNLPFIFFAAVGTDDFNFPELKDLENKLIKVGLTHRLAVFSGDHEWLSAAVASEAIGWMELAAMKAGTREKDPNLIDAIWQARLTAAQTLADSGRPYEAYRDYQAMSSSFSGLKDVAAITGKIAQLKEDKIVKKSISEEKSEIDKQNAQLNQITGLLSQRRDPENGLTATGEFRSIINNLSKQGKEPQDSSQRRVARRVIRSLLVGAYEQGEGRLRAEDYAGAVYQFEIATEIAPNNPRLFFSLACAQALAGQKGRALQTLRRAIEKGFKDLESITTNRALDSLRGEAVYIEIVNSLKK